MSCIDRSVLLLLLGLCCCTYIEAGRITNFLGSSKGRTSSNINSTNGIPHIIHQSWSSKHLPEQYAAWQRTWTDLNPDWTYKLWTDSDNHVLVKNHFPWLLQAYERFPQKIMRADFARYLYMSKYGGVYVDLDSECLRPLDSLLTTITGAGLGRMSDHATSLHAIPNAFLASEPAHPFWDFCIATSLVRSAGPHMWSASYQMKAPEHVTGPAALQAALGAYVQHGGGLKRVTLLAPGVVYPIDWGLERAEPWVTACIARREKTFDGAACRASVKKRTPDAYMATFWAHSWAIDR